MGDVTGKLGNVASDVGHRAREIGRSTQNRLSRTMRDNPLALGAVAVIAGAVIGSMLPRSAVEDSYLGETRDDLVDSAKEIAHEKVQKLSDATRPSGAGSSTASL